MKKKVILATLTAATLAIGCGAFVACGHSHTYSDKWDNDAAGHWHTATCDDLKEGDEKYTKDYAAHVWGDDNECDVCHYIKADGEHTHTYTVWGRSDAEHWKECEADGEIDESTRAAHDYTNGDCECGKADPNGGGETSSVTLSVTQITLGISNTEYSDLTATVAGGGEVTWSSDNPGVVSVGENNGFVEALKPGAATITATAENGDTAECEVVVEDAYYIIGGSDSSWNKVAAFGQSSAIYFMPTETEGVYKTESFELNRLGNFQVAPVGDTSGDWWKKAFNGEYIAAGDAVLSKNDGGNIAVEKHGMYTVTLDLTGDKAVISGVCDREIDDGEVEDVYYIIGSANASTQWTLLTEASAAGEYAFTKNADGTYSLTVELTKGGAFKVAIVGMNWDGALGESALARTGGSCDCETALIGNAGTATPDTDYKLEWTSGGDNIGVGVSGRYIFTLTPGAEAHHQLTYTFETTAATGAAQVLHYYIKGTAVEGGWNAPANSTNELTETSEGTDVYSISIHLSAGEFMFYSYAEDGEGNVVASQVDYFNAGNSTLDTGVTEVTAASSNFTAVNAGTYTLSLNVKTKVLSVSFVADSVTPEAE